MRGVPIWPVLFPALLATTVAAGGPRPAQRVTFEAGKSTTQLKGTVRGDQTVEYLLAAKARQTLSLEVTASNPNHDVVFTVKSPSGRSLVGEEGEDYDSKWSGRLTETGDFRISVSTIESDQSPFTIAVSLR